MWLGGPGDVDGLPLMFWNQQQSAWPRVPLAGINGPSGAHNTISGHKQSDLPLAVVHPGNRKHQIPKLPGGGQTLWCSNTEGIWTRSAGHGLSLSLSHDVRQIYNQVQSSLCGPPPGAKNRVPEVFTTPVGSAAPRSWYPSSVRVLPGDKGRSPQRLTHLPAIFLLCTSYWSLSTWVQLSSFPISLLFKI